MHFLYITEAQRTQSKWSIMAFPILPNIFCIFTTDRFLLIVDRATSSNKERLFHWNSTPQNVVEKALMMLLVGFSKIMTHSSRVPAKKDCNYTFSVQCTFVHVLGGFGDNWSQIMITDGLQKAINIFFMILVQFLAEMFLVSDTNLRWQIPETFSIFGRSLSGIYWRGMGGTVFVQPVRYLSKQILWKSSYQ